MRRRGVLVAAVSSTLVFLVLPFLCLAVTAPCPNGLGIYFDQTADNNCLFSAPPYMTVTAYLCATNLTTNGISGWECSVRTNPATLPAGLTVTLFHGALNVLAPPLFNVGIPAVGGASGNPVVLASLSTFYLGGTIEFAIGPCTPSTFGGLTAGFTAGDDPGLLTPFDIVSEWPFPGFESTYLVASVNAVLCPVLSCDDPVVVIDAIGDLQQYAADGAPQSPYHDVAIRLFGRVTAASNQFGDGQAYAQDATGGVALVGPYVSGCGLAIGDTITVHGQGGTLGGEVVVSSAVPTNYGQVGAPEPLLLTIAEALDYEQVGRLVNVYGRVGQPGPGGFRLEIGTTYLPVVVAGATGIALAEVGLADQYSVTGILRVRDGQIQLWPRMQADLVEVASPYFFQIGIIAACAGLQDLGNVLGTAAGATDGFDAALEPPEPPHAPNNYLTAYFAHPEWGSPLGEGFTKDLRQDYDLNFDRKTWPFSVLTDRVGTVTLTFSPTFTGNTGYDIVIEDVATGDLTFLLPELAYAYESAGAGRRDFLIHVGRYYEVPALDPATRSVAPGWSMLGLPLVPVEGQTTVGSILFDNVAGTGWVFEYLGDTGYGMVATDHVWPRGQGLWFAGLQPFDWEMQGVRDIGTTDIPLVEGWNMLGHPLWFTLPLANVRVLHGGTVSSYAEAVAANLIAGNVYGWDTAAGDYMTAVDLQAWHCYWVAAYAPGVALRFNYRYLYDAKALSLAKADLPPAEPDGGDWRVPVIVNDRSGRSGRLVIGVSPEATDGFDAAWDLPVPPASPRGPAPQLAADHPEWNLAAGAGFATDVRAAKNGSQVWRARVSLPQTGTATLGWDPASWPRDLDLNLYLPSQNRVVVRSMRAQASVGLDVPAEGLVVEFRTPDHVTGVPPDAVAALGLHCVPNPFNPLTEVRFELPRAARAEVRLYDARGREVRRLAGGELGAGPQALRWDGRDAAGAEAASGTYFARLYLDGEAAGRAVKASLVR